MKLTTKLKIAAHKRHCPLVFRIDCKSTPTSIKYLCEFERKVIASEPRLTEQAIRI